MAADWPRALHRVVMSRVWARCLSVSRKFHRPEHDLQMQMAAEGDAYDESVASSAAVREDRMTAREIIEAVALEKIDVCITLRGPALDESLSDKERSEIAAIIHQAVEESNCKPPRRHLSKTSRKQTDKSRFHR